MRVSLFILGVFAAVACAEGPAEAVQSAFVRYVAQAGVRGYRVTARAVDDVALDSPEVGHRTEGLPGAGRDGSRGLEE